MRDENQDTIVHAKVDETQGPKVKRKDACLVVIYGQDLGRKYNIVGRDLRIGRATTNDICLSQDAVSREHAYIIVDDFGIKIRDNDSTNGTYINDNKIHEAYLRDGDLVKVGRSIFKFLSGENIESSYHEEIFRLSTVDGLTQVFNRRYFMETLERGPALGRLRLAGSEVEEAHDCRPLLAEHRLLGRARHGAHE